MQVLAEVTTSAQAAEKVKTAVQVVKDRAQKIVDEINSEKFVAEGKLEAAKPALMEAERALQVSLNLLFMSITEPCGFLLLCRLLFLFKDNLTFVKYK